MNILKFEEYIPELTIGLKRNNEMLFDFFLLNLYKMKINDGYKVAEILSVTEDGIRVVFEKLNDDKDILSYKEVIEENTREFKNKYRDILKKI